MTYLDDRHKKLENGEPLLVIVGETASGKSAWGLQLAERLNGEIICADSWTVYKGFDIGTAKPTPADRAQVPHHLLDVADPAEGFSVVVFQKMAKEAIADITATGKLPIMVGGAGLYVDSVLYDYGFLAKPPVGLREQLNALNLEELQAKAWAMGLDTGAIDIRNKRRVIRLIENNGQLPSKQTIRQNSLVLGIASERDQLKPRIESRVDEMLRDGLEREALGLAERYGWEAEPMKGIGYREWQSYQAGTQSLEETRARIIKATLDLAKRQRTWFKRNSSIQWLNDRSNDVDIITTFLNK